MPFASAGNIAFNRHGWPVFMPIFKFACKWAVSKKFDTGFAQIFVCEISIYLFGSYLRFKSVYKLLDIKPIWFTPIYLKWPLKIQNKACMRMYKVKK